MMYPFMTLNDGTEVVHSEARDNNGQEYVKVYFEKPVVGGFHSAYCTIPGYDWSQIEGFTPKELDAYQKYLETVAHIIIELSREGGFENASNF